MKTKKYSYLILIIFMLLIGINDVSGKTCYYMSDDKQGKAILDITKKKENKYKYDLTINQLGAKIDDDDEPIINAKKDFKDKKETGIVVDNIGITKNGKCPQYLVLRTTTSYDSYGVFAFSSLAEAEKFAAKSNKISDLKAWVTQYKDPTTDEKYTKKDYFSTFVNGNIIDPSYEIECTDLFGDSSDENSLAYLIDMILSYVRIIVPILIIVLGSLDLGKAVIAGREDEMKKAQTTFIKRIFIGLIVFFVPVIVDLVMWLADIVWESFGYTTCTFK